MSPLRTSTALLLLALGATNVISSGEAVAEPGDRALKGAPASRSAAPPPADPLMQAQSESWAAAKSSAVRAKHLTPCIGGFAGAYPCANVDLLALVPVADFAATATNSLWGWTDSTSGIEYALVGANNGIAFFELSTPDHPRYLGKLPTHAGTGSSSWRDVRVYADHAYVVSDNNGNHGMQVFDLAQLRSVATPQAFAETAHFAAGGVGPGHTIAINEQTGYAYISGSDACGGATLQVDIRVPASPVSAGCLPGGAYTHETQCWIYQGPDAQHAGREICFESKGANRRIEIVDVTNHASPVVLSTLPYAGARYTHQGWLTPDHRFLLVNDELDEQAFGHGARTYVIDVGDLDAPFLAGFHEHALPAIDHNLYVHGNHVFASHYEAGLRILRLGNLSQAQMTEVAYFDTYPAGNAATFNGMWNNYRFPGSGNVIATGIGEGLFVLRPNLCAAPAAVTGLVAAANGDNRIDLSWTPGSAASHRIERAQGGCAGAFEAIADAATGDSYADTGVSGGVPFGYRVVARDAAGTCEAVASACVVAQTSGACTAAPQFSGLAQAQSSGLAQCGIDLSWNAAAPACAGAASYSVYRSGSPDVVPSAATLVASGIAATTWRDTSALSGVPYHYVVRARDGGNGAEDGNTIERSAAAGGANVDGTFASGAEPGQPQLDSSSSEDAVLAKAGASAKHAGWHVSLDRSHGGERSFWSTNANSLCVSLISPVLRLTAGQVPQLSFWSARDAGGTSDGGVIEASANGGSSWTKLTPTGGYPGTIGSGGTRCGMSNGAGAFTGTNLAWTQSTVPLSSFAGQDVMLRWRYRTDTTVAGEGWFVDDLAITHAQVPGTCTRVDALLRDGFE